MTTKREKQAMALTAVEVLQEQEGKWITLQQGMNQMHGKMLDADRDARLDENQTLRALGYAEHILMTKEYGQTSLAIKRQSWAKEVEGEDKEIIGVRKIAWRIAQPEDEKWLNKSRDIRDKNRNGNNENLMTMQKGATSNGLLHNTEPLEKLIARSVLELMQSDEQYKLK